MNVVRHDYPALQSIFLSIEMMEGFGDHVRNLRAAQMTFPGALIQITFDLAAKIPVHFGGLLGGEIAQCLRMLPLELKQHVPGKRVCEPKGNKIRCAFPFDMWQITAVMNTASQWAVCRIGDAGGPQSEIDALQAWIGFPGFHAENL
jgi:hypothetical protein